MEPEQTAQTVIPYFLRALMKIERERKGMSRQAASFKAKWSPSTWGNLERNTRSLQPHHWMNISAVLDLTREDEARRLNAFIGKHPNLWLERIDPTETIVYERALTSPRRIRSAKVFNAYLDPVRPALYYELSSYTAEPETLIEIAARLDYLKIRNRPSQEPTPPPPRAREIDTPKAQREKLCDMIMHAVADENLGLLDRVLDKFERFGPRELALAYKHFSLSLTD